MISNFSLSLHKIALEDEKTRKYEKAEPDRASMQKKGY